MASIKLRYKRYEAKVRIPLANRAAHEGKEFLYRTLKTSDRRIAQVEADAWEAELRLQWSVADGCTQPEPGTIRHHYQSLRQKAAAREFLLYTNEDEDPAVLGIDHEIDKIAEAVGERDLKPVEEASLAALQDAISDLQGQKKPTPGRI